MTPKSESGEGFDFDLLAGIPSYESGVWGCVDDIRAATKLETSGLVTCQLRSDNRLEYRRTAKGDNRIDPPQILIPEHMAEHFAAKEQA